MTMTPDVDAVTAQITAEFPKYQRKNKADVWWMKALGVIFGSDFMASYVTTILNTMYMPSCWPTMRSTASARCSGTSGPT